MDIDTFFARSETGTSTNSYYGVHPHEPYRWQTQGSLTRPEPKGAKKTLKKPDKLMKARTVGRGKGPDPWVHMKVKQVKRGKGARLAGEGRNCQTGEGVRLAGEGARLAGEGHCAPKLQKKGRGKQGRHRPAALTGGGKRLRMLNVQQGMGKMYGGMFAALARRLNVKKGPGFARDFKRMAANLAPKFIKDMKPYAGQLTDKALDALKVKGELRAKLKADIDKYMAGQGRRIWKGNQGGRGFASFMKKLWAKIKAGVAQVKKLKNTEVGKALNSAAKAAVTSYNPEAGKMYDMADKAVDYVG